MCQDSFPNAPENRFLSPPVPSTAHSTSAPLISRGLRKFPAPARKISQSTFAIQLPGFTIFTLKLFSPEGSSQLLLFPCILRIPWFNPQIPLQVPAITNSNHLHSLFCSHRGETRNTPFYKKTHSPLTAHPSPTSSDSERVNHAGLRPQSTFSSCQNLPVSQFAKRTSLLGKLTCGRVGNPIPPIPANSTSRSTGNFRSPNSKTPAISHISPNFLSLHFRKPCKSKCWQSGGEGCD
jgi:hypothetical protein